MSRLRLAFPLLTALSLAACGGDDEPSDPGDELLEPPAPGEGIQYQMTTTLDPGVEAEHCQFVLAPDEEMWVASNEVRFTQGSHHVLMYETDYDSIPTQNEYGEAVDTSGVFDCTSGATDGWRVTKLVGGSQNGEGESLLNFPDGVAMPVRAGAVLLMNAHYINASDQKVEPEVRMNIYTIPKEEVVTEGDLLFLYNPIIKVAGKSASRARWRCPVHQDITLSNVQSHMHRRGVGFAAMVTGEDPFYENDAWSNVPVKQFEPGLQVSAGSTLDYYCDYENGESRTVYQGPKSTDEMCMLIGSYYPADPRTSNCMDDSGEQLAGEWVGQGTATCAETMNCVAAITPGDEHSFEVITDCMLAADPSVSRETSDLLLCYLSSANPLADCADQIGTCQAL